MYKEYEPNERIVDRAVALWKDMLGYPKYDNGDRTGPSGLACIMASMLPKNNTSEVLDRFGEELKKLLMEKAEYESKSYNDKPFTYEGPFDDMHVDYGPSFPLQRAAFLSGLEMEFPYKTNMWLTESYLTLSAGYAAPHVYHYPLSSDRWLETTLHGSDIDVILDLIENGVIDPQLFEPLSA